MNASPPSVQISAAIGGSVTFVELADADYSDTGSTTYDDGHTLCGPRSFSIPYDSYLTLIATDNTLYLDAADPLTLA